MHVKCFVVVQGGDFSWKNKSKKRKNTSFSFEALLSEWNIFQISEGDYIQRLLKSVE